MRGLTHILVCEDRFTQPFTMVIGPEGRPEILSSQRITRDPRANEICGGLVIAPSARAADDGRIDGGDAQIDCLAPRLRAERDRTGIHSAMP